MKSCLVSKGQLQPKALKAFGGQRDRERERVLGPWFFASIHVLHARIVHTARTHCARRMHALCTLHARMVHAAGTHCAHCTHPLCKLQARTHCPHFTHALCTLHARTHCACCTHALCTLHARIVHAARASVCYFGGFQGLRSARSARSNVLAGCSMGRGWLLRAGTQKIKGGIQANESEASLCLPDLLLHVNLQSTVERPSHYTQKWG